jgi:hypothetical protein
MITRLAAAHCYPGPGCRNGVPHSGAGREVCRKWAPCQLCAPGAEKVPKSLTVLVMSQIIEVTTRATFHVPLNFTRILPGNFPVP